MTHQHELDRIALQYLSAVESGDFDTLSALWLAAQSASELSDMLHGLNTELALEQDHRQTAADKTALETAIEKHLPSAEVIRPISGPLTAAEVAEHLRKHPPHGLTADDLKLNELLRSASEVVPLELGMSQVVSWGRKFGSAPEGYWKAFRETALLLRMRRESAENYQMAARPTKPAPKPTGETK